MKKLLLTMILFAIVMSCKEDDDVVPNRVIFTMTLKSPQFKGDKWIVLRDNDTGELIDSRQVKSDTAAVFESTRKIASGKMTVTFFRSPEDAGYAAHSRVFRGIEVGTSWTWTDDVRNKSNPDSPFLAGSYDLTMMRSANLKSTWAY